MSDADLLSDYYKISYPFDSIMKFLRYEINREFSVTLNNNIYIRYLSFNNVSEFKSFIHHKIPQKIDFGAVYTTKPKIGMELHPHKRELVFDIDLTDYTRKCCDGKHICNKCFTIIKCAAHIMDRILKEHFGYKDILFVFSGGRGLHVWVCDDDALILDNRERRGIVNYISKKNKNVVLCVEDILRRYTHYFKEQDMEGIDDLRELAEHLFVKLDINVTVDIKHLLKGPFSCHPTSKKISVPLSLKRLDEITVEELPNLENVVANPDLLNEYISFFDNFCNKIIKVY